MHLIQKVITLGTILLLAISAYSQDKAVEIDSLLSKYHSYEKFNGSALIAKGNDILLAKGYGKANMEWDIPNEPDTRFRIGSVTKQFTAALILQLMEEGDIDLQGKITDYLPDYPKEQGDKVTIHQLLSHTSGIPSYTGLPRFRDELMREPFDPDSFLTVFSKLDFEFEPGTQYRYNNSGYFLLGTIIEKITGMSFDEALQVRLLDPLNLKDTGYDHFTEVIENRAAGYSNTPTGHEHAAYLDTSIPYSAGMMYSTVGDLLKWTRALHMGKPFKKKETLQKMTTPNMRNYGYGLNISEDSVGNHTVRRIMHGGGINGFTAWLEYMPEQEYTIAVLDNTQGFLGELTQNISKILYDQPVKQPKLSIASEMGRVIEDQNIDAAIRHYRELKKNKPESYDFSESELNILGYYYLEQREIEKAIEVLKLNVEMYPDAFNVYDSLGEAYMEGAQNELAIKNYQKSLELNPGNENAKERLRILGAQPKEINIQVPEEVMDSYVGKYELQPDFVITIIKEEDKMFAQATGQARIEMIAASESRFYLKGVDAQLTFNRNNGKVESLTLTQNGQDAPAKKIQ